MDHAPAKSLDQLQGQPAGRFTRHRDAMLLLETLTEVSGEHAVCTWRPPTSHTVLNDGKGFPAYIAIECMAQCVAVHAGALASLKGLGPPLGLLLGTRSFKATETHLEAGVEYRVRCRELLRDPQGLASFDCNIRKGDIEVAACHLAVYQFAPGTEPDDRT